jgi:hypothetical protein
MMAGELETYSREKRYIRRDGTPVWGRVSASLVRKPDTGEPLLAVAVIEDIDDHYKAQLALAQAKQDLEAVVEERTAALAQRDLLLREVYHRVKNNLQIVDSMLLLQAAPAVGPRAQGGAGERCAAASMRWAWCTPADGLRRTWRPSRSGLPRGAVAAPCSKARATAGVTLAVEAPRCTSASISHSAGACLVTELVTNSIKHGLPPPEGRGAIDVPARGSGR